MPFLWLVLSVEVFGWLPAINYFYPESGFIKGIRSFFPARFYETNMWLFNVFKIVQLLFYMNFYRKITINKKFDIIVGLWMIFLAVTVFISFPLADNFFEEWVFMPVFVGSLGVLVSALLYFIDVLRGDELLGLTKKMTFWFSTGILVFYLTTTPIIIFSKFLNFSQYYTYILTACNLVLYGSFIIGFIVHARQERGKTPF